MRNIALFCPSVSLLAAFATPAFAHGGHIGELAGHDHIIAGVALGAAIGLAIWGALSGKDKKGKDTSAEAETEADSEPQEA